MSAGGFKFAKVTITAVAADYATVIDWCLAVHKARCEAFLRATGRELAHWTPIETRLTGETTAAVNYDDSNTVNVYYAQIAPSTSHPALISYFRDTDSSTEYAILTGASFCWNSSSSAYAYINPKRLNQLSGDIEKYFIAPSFMHALAINGFGSYDVSADTVASCEIPFTAQYGNGTLVVASGASNGYSMIERYSERPFTGVNYTFGFAVKGAVIESFYQTGTSQPLWSIIGEIFNSDCVGGNPYGVLCCPSSSESDASISLSTQRWIRDIRPLLCVIDVNNAAYPSKAIHDSTPYIKACCLPSYIGERWNANIPTNVYYGALCCSFDFNSTASFAGIDADGNLQKGYINTDVLRVVSRHLCAYAGSIFQGGNFISMGGGMADTGYPFGIILGWDASNDSLM